MNDGCENAGVNSGFLLAVFPRGGSKEAFSFDGYGSLFTKRRAFFPLTLGVTNLRPVQKLTLRKRLFGSNCSRFDIRSRRCQNVFVVRGFRLFFFFSVSVRRVRVLVVPPKRSSTP